MYIIEEIETSYWDHHRASLYGYDILDAGIGKAGSAVEKLKVRKTKTVSCRMIIIAEEILDSVHPLLPLVLSALVFVYVAGSRRCLESEISVGFQVFCVEKKRGSSDVAYSVQPELCHVMEKAGGERHGFSLAKSRRALRFLYETRNAKSLGG